MSDSINQLHPAAILAQGGETRQGIIVGHMVDLFLRLLSLGDILDYPVIRDKPSMFIKLRDGRIIHPYCSPVLSCDSMFNTPGLLTLMSLSFKLVMSEW
jgi:hypothetical protein